METATMGIIAATALGALGALLTGAVTAIKNRATIHAWLNETREWTRRRQLAVAAGIAIAGGIATAGTGTVLERVIGNESAEPGTEATYETQRRREAEALIDGMIAGMMENIPALTSQGERVTLVYTLASIRHRFSARARCPLTEQGLQALNKVPLAFAENSGVIESYNTLIRNNVYPEEAFRTMLSRMAGAVGIEEPALAEHAILFSCGQAATSIERTPGRD